MAVEIPASLERRLSDLVAAHLAAELGRRGLLLAADDLAASEQTGAELGLGLASSVLQRSYPAEAGVEFDGEQVAARLRGALAFGAATARVLRPRSDTPEEIELACAVFNLGIGLVDSVCDGDAEAGSALLELIQTADLGGAVVERRTRGWLRAALSPRLGADYTIAFTVEVIEVFFETLHTSYPGDAWLEQRRKIGAQLGAALKAERSSLLGSTKTARAELIEYSRLTSVLPFEIIATLTRGGEDSVGTLLGEAMWLIDDLVDLCQDARTGALNAVLLRFPDEPGSLEQLLASDAVGLAAADAAEKLLSGLRNAAVADQRLFLYFIQRYAGIVGS